MQISDQWIVIFSANRNRNKLAEPTSVWIGIWIVCESQNLWIGIGIIFVRWEVFANYSQLPEIIFLSDFSNNFFSWVLYIFPLKNLPGKENHIEIYAHSLYIFIIKIRYSWILLNIFLNRNIICQITILVNRNNIYEMKLWQIGIGIYLSPKYQQIDEWQIYCKLFTNYSQIENYLLNADANGT